MSSPSDIEEKRKQANLRLLQRVISPDICDISLSGTHVVLYEFKENSWHKSGYEGSCFLCNSPSQYQFIVLNRNSTDNFAMPVTATLQMQHQDPYLIFKTNDKRIRGVWFHNAEERITMADSMQSLVEKLNSGHLPSAPPNVNIDQTAALAAMLGISKLNVSDSSEPTSTQTTPQQQIPTSPHPAGSVTPPPAGVALDKKSLQLALLSLLQDDRFLDLLHSQYLRVVHARAKKKGSNGNNE